MSAHAKPTYKCAELAREVLELWLADRSRHGGAGFKRDCFSDTERGADRAAWCYAGAPPKTFRAGEALFRCGDRDSNFFVIKSGEVELVDETGEKPKAIRVLGAGEFTGDVGHLTGNPKVVNSEVYEISDKALREILNQDSQLSDIILQAFIARRQLMRESDDFTGLRVIGSRYSRDTFRIRDFLAKNRVLFTWLDLEGDPAVGQLLKQFGVTEADTPIVACAHRVFLRNPSNRELAETISIRRPVEHVVYDLAIVVACTRQQ